VRVSGREEAVAFENGEGQLLLRGDPGGRTVQVRSRWETTKTTAGHVQGCQNGSVRRWVSGHWALRPAAQLP